MEDTGMREVPLVAGRGVALVDDADYEMVSRYRWHAHPHRRTTYARRFWQDNGKQRSQYMHAMITGEAAADHDSGDGLDNQRANLRPATGSQNHANQRKSMSYAGTPTTSRYKGVSWHRSGKWHVRIMANGKSHYLGSFTDGAFAAGIYDAAAYLLFDEYARPNFPLEAEGRKDQ